MMKKKGYQKPTIEFEQLQHHAHLLQASGSGLNDPNDYDDGGDPFTY